MLYPFVSDFENYSISPAFKFYEMKTTGNNMLLYHLWFTLNLVSMFLHNSIYSSSNTGIQAGLQSPGNYQLLE